MNTTAAATIHRIQSGHTISTQSIQKLKTTCQQVGGAAGAWALCVVASKCYLANKYQLAFDLFSCTLELDSQHRSQASKIAWTYSGDVLGSAAGKTINLNWTQLERWRIAQDYYNCALAMDARFVDAKSSLAELLRKRGDLDAALLEFQSIYSCVGLATTSPTSPTSSDSLDLIFNHAQCLESMCRYEESLLVLVQHAERAIHQLPSVGDATRVAEHALILLYIKLRFLCGQFNEKSTTSWTTLVTLSQKWSTTVANTIRHKLPTHWAYAFFLRQLWMLRNNSSNGSLDERLPRWIPIVGDSHCLSMAWARISNATIVPFVATGLKAWHMRKDCQFVTASNLKCIFKHLAAADTATKECFFCVGEIDCREGIANAVKKGKYATVEEAVKSTVCLVLDRLVCISVEYGLTFHLLSVPPPVDRCQIERARVVQLWNKELRCQICGEIKEHLRLVDVEHVSADGMFLKKHLNADGTHVNRNIVSLVAEVLEGGVERRRVELEKRR